jgi:hypothetical protein
MKIIRLLLLTACIVLGLGVVTHAQNRGRNTASAISEYQQKDSIERDGYKLVFYSNAPDFSPTVMDAFIKTFFTVYPVLVEQYNKNASKKVFFAVDTNYHGVAVTYNNRVFFNPEWFVKNPNDFDVVTHEVMHIVQSYGRNRVPVWVMEGIADYVRYKYGLYNREANWMLPELKPEHHYTGSYRITARFFAWLEEQRYPQIVNKLDKAARENKFSDNIWKELTGYTIDELWEDYRRTPKLRTQ